MLLRLELAVREGEMRQRLTKDEVRKFHIFLHVTEPRMAMPKQKSRAASRGNELTRSMEPDNFSLFVRAPCEAVRSH